MTATAVGARRPTRRARLVPDQHGAWAFLALPVGLGVTATTWTWLLVPTALAWLLAYPAAWALTGRLTAPRPERFDHALRLWAPLALLAAAPVLVARPWLVWAAVLYAALWLVNLQFARQRRERALVNDIVLVVECSALVPVIAGIGVATSGWAPPLHVVDGQVILLTLVCLVTLTASVLHVKSLIRERGDARYARAAKDFAVAGAVVVALVSLGTDTPVWPALVLLATGSRCWWVPRSWRPARVGLVELACFVLVAATFVVAS